jgi:4-carboxymuconolactone decarboxylase
MRLSSQIPRTQKLMYYDVKAGISSSLNNFVSQTEDGALLGPWGVRIHQPIVGKITRDWVKVLSASGRLPERIRQIAIFCVGSRFNAAYELYAHVAMAKTIGVEESMLTTLAAGGRPADLDKKEGCAYCVGQRRSAADYNL